MGSVEESGHGAAQHSLARLQWLCWHRAGGTRGTQQGLAVTVPLLYQDILEMRFQLWMRLPKHQTTPGPWLLCWCEISINISQRIAPGRFVFHQQEAGPALSPFPHDLLHPKKISSKGRRARGSLDVKAELALITQIWVAENLGLWNNQDWISAGSFLSCPSSGNSCQVYHWGQPHAAGDGKPSLCQPWLLHTRGSSSSPGSPGAARGSQGQSHPVSQLCLSCATKLQPKERPGLCEVFVHFVLTRWGSTSASLCPPHPWDAGLD